MVNRKRIPTVVWMAALFALGWLATGCIVKSSDPAAVFNETPLPEVIRVSEITVFESEVTNLEVEVHLFDAATGQSVGCAGQAHGLQGIDDIGVAYIVSAELVTRDSAPLLFEDLADLDLIVRVIEDDLLPCPGEIDSQDDLIGESEIIAGSELEPVLYLEFDDVMHLAIGSARSRLPDDSAP